MLLLATFTVAAQEKEEKKGAATPTPAPAATPLPILASKDQLKNPTAEQLAETVIFIYGLGGGRATLNHIRKTAFERGKISILNSSGAMEQAAYQKWTTRPEAEGKEKVRFDQEFPTARYSLVMNDDKIFGIFNNEQFTPRDDASRAFQNQIVYGLETLLRYKENGSKIEYAGTDKIMGVDLYLLDVTDKQDRSTRFYIRTKSYRVMMLEYQDQGIKYRRKYYDYNVAQGTLFAFRSVLYAGDKIVEETEIGTVTFGQKIDDGMFTVSS